MSQKLVLIAGGAAAVAAVACCLLGEPKDKNPSDEEVRQVQEPTVPAAPKNKNLSKEEVRQLLEKISESQAKMKAAIPTLSKQLREEPVSFEQTCERVKKMQPDDPLEKHGFSMEDLEATLAQYEQDPDIRAGIAKLMGAPSMGPIESSVSVQKLLQVHNSMLEELETVSQEARSRSIQNAFDAKIITVAAQVIVAAKVQEKYGLTAEDIEKGVMKNHETLAKSKEFQQINSKMQRTMQSLMSP